MVNTIVPVTLYSNMLIFRDTKKSFKLVGDLLKRMKIHKVNVDHSNPQDRKITYEFGKEMKFVIKQKGRPSNRDKSEIKLLNSLTIMASSISNTIFLPPNPLELCDRIKFLLQEKEAGNNSDLIKEEIVVLIDKLFQYKCIFKKQQKQILNK